MLLNLFLLSTIGVAVSEYECYWNKHCSYQYFSIATPYDTIRGDIRDYASPQNCEAISLWSLHRHGNRNPGKILLSDINQLQVKLKKEIITSYSENRCSLCSQDIEDMLNFEWNITSDIIPSCLNQIGYKEMYSIGQRIKNKYSKLLFGTGDQYYFRSTEDKRTTDSVRAFLQGLTEGPDKNLSLSIDKPRARDYMLRGYENCEFYRKWVQSGPQLANELSAYDQGSEVLAVRDRVVKRIGTTNQLSLAEIFNIYDLCRYHRSWSSNLKCPWCSLFTDEDLMVLEYRDDVRHYFKNGYGSTINAALGRPVLKDLYENFLAATKGEGKNIVSYFTHNTVLEMILTALGLFKDSTANRGNKMNTSRIWRTSYINPFAANFIAILNRCELEDTYRVQFFLNEKVTSLCPVEGCTWQKFVDIFQAFSNSSFSFCSQNQSSLEKNTNNNAVSILYCKVLLLVLVLGILY